MLIELTRDDYRTTKTFGKMFVDGKYLGETLEDAVRDTKIDGETAIPTGRYRVSITFSNRFQRPMPYVHNVPEFEGVRIHGGNTEEDTHGCPLLGNIRTKEGITQCAGANARLLHLIEDAEDRGEEVWLQVS